MAYTGIKQYSSAVLSVETAPGDDTYCIILINITIFDQHEQRLQAVHTAAALKLTQTNRQLLIFVFIQSSKISPDAVCVLGFHR